MKNEQNVKTTRESQSAVVVDRPDDLKQKYNELIMAVIRKYPGESRHETALRYIQEAENQENPGCK